jgi:hypothetical protein
MPAQVALRGQPIDQTVEGQILMGIGAEGDLSDPIQ